MKYILREPGQKFILTESTSTQILLEDDNMTFDGEGDMMLDIEAETPVISDYKAELLNAEKANNQELVEKIWELFYTEFTENELTDTAANITPEDLKNLGQAFRVECTTLGFTLNTNVFLQFLKNNQYLIKNMTAQSYAILHNKCGERLNGAVSKEDLLGKGSLGKNNIIFCIDLYSHSVDDIAEYLDLQASIKTKISKDNLVDTFLQCFYKSGFIKDNIKNATLLAIFEVKEQLAVNNLSDEIIKKDIIIKAGDNEAVDKLVNTLINNAPVGSEKEIALQAALNILSNLGDNLGQHDVAKMLATAKIDPKATLSLDIAQMMTNNAIFTKNLKNIKLENREMLQTILNKLGEKINN